MKVKTKKNIKQQKIAQIEVKEKHKNDVLSHSYTMANSLISHNCNGPHVPLVVVDEIDTVSGEGLKAFKEISGMLDSKGTKNALRVGISTRKSRYGLMNQQIDNAEEEGRTIRRWTAFEFSERCPDERSGTKEVDLYVSQEKMLAITPEEYDKRSKQKQAEFLKYTFPGEKCQKCKIAAICLGDAKKQTSKSPMLKPITDIISKVKKEGSDWALAQLMNLKPSVEGIVFREYDERIHAKTWNEMWKQLVGIDFPGECTHDIFVKKCFSDDTEVLTDNGFKLFKDLNRDDKVASLDDDGKLIYESPTDYISYHHEGDMYSINNEIGGHGKQLDLLVTPEHQQTYVRRDDFRKGKINIIKRPVEDLPNGDFCIPSTYLKDGYDQEGYSSPISFMTDDQFYAFLGLWLSEGSMSSVRANTEWRQNEVSVSQYKKVYVDKVAEFMRSISWPSKLHYKRDDERYEHGNAGRWSVYNKELYTYLKPYKFAENKSIPREIMNNASLSQLKILYEWLMLGDGANYDKDNKQQPYYGTGSKQLADDVQELAFKLGYRTNLTKKYKIKNKLRKDGSRKLIMHRIHVHSKDRNGSSRKSWYIKSSTHVSEFGNKNKHIEKTKGYKGQVYCVTMPSGRLFVRRNGVIALSGNCHEMKIPCYAGVDWGWSSPNTVVYLFIDKRDNVYIVRTDGMTYVSQPAWIHHCKTKYHSMYKCQLYFPDVADQGAVEEMKKAGLPVATEVDKAINTGIQVIKKLLRVPGTEDTQMFIAKETCSELMQEFLLYHFKTNTAGLITENPEDEYNHWIDALRYVLSMLMGKSLMMMSMDSDGEYDGKVFDSTKQQYFRTPSAGEFAETQGIRVNTDIDTSKIGKIGTKSELDDEDEDDDVEGSGGFLWSF